MFGEFKVGARWVERMQKLATEEGYVYSTLGRRRFLPAVLTGDRSVISAQVRRGVNAPIQGMASEIGIKASRCLLESYYKHSPKLMKLLGHSSTIWKMRILYNRVVHDANYLAVPYLMVIPVAHIMQWEATYGVTDRYRQEFGLDFTVEPEIEMEFAAQDSKSYKWSWSLEELPEVIRSAVIDADKLGQLEAEAEKHEDRVNEVMEIILQSWRNEKVRHYLQKYFPLLGVPDLDMQIKRALKLYDKKYS